MSDTATTFTSGPAHFDADAFLRAMVDIIKDRYPHVQYFHSLDENMKYVERRGLPPSVFVKITFEIVEPENVGDGTGMERRDAGR